MTDPTVSPRQLQTLRARPARVEVLHGAVRSGKTVASLLRLVAAIQRMRDLPGEIVISGRTRQAIARNLFAPLADRSLFGAIAGTCTYVSGADAGWILGQRVWVIGAGDARAEAVLRGLTCKLIYIDELTLVPEPYYRQCLNRLSVPGARLIATTNPDGPRHWVKVEVIDKAQALGYHQWKFGLDDNPHLDPTYRASLEREHSGLWRARMIDGEWAVAEGAIYPMWSEAKHVARVDPESVHTWIADGIDYGTTTPTRGIRVGVARYGDEARLVVTGEWSPPVGAPDAQQSAEYRAWSAAAPGDPRWVVVDPAAASLRVQLATDGLSPVRGDNAVVPGVRLIGSLLSLPGRLVVDPACQELIREFPGYVWAPEPSHREGVDGPVKRDDHSLDALRYAIVTTRSEWSRWVSVGTP